MPDYDLIVVGAGPAGSSMALHAARLGLSVLLTDRVKLPREKACGDALTSLTIQCVAELGLTDRLLELPHTKVSTVTYFAPNNASVTVPLLKLDKAAPVTSLVCRRVLFDDMLQEAAREEVEMLDWCRVTEVLRENGRAMGIHADLGGGRIMEATARVVAGADGVQSLVARRMSPYRYPRFRTVAAQAYFRQATGLQGGLEVRFPEELLPGYLWINPTESGMTNVGVCMPLDAALARRFKPRRALEQALERPDIRDRLRFAERMGSVKVALLPVADVTREVHGPGYVLVGDAAGIIRPAGTHGVANAMISGRVAARAVARACAETDCGEAGLRPYAHGLWKELGPMASLSRRLLALRTPKAIASLVRSASRRPANAGWISGILLGLAMPSEEVDDFLSYLDFFSR